MYQIFLFTLRKQNKTECFDKTCSINRLLSSRVHNSVPDSDFTNHSTIQLLSHPYSVLSSRLSLRIGIRDSVYPSLCSPRFKYCHLIIQSTSTVHYSVNDSESMNQFMDYDLVQIFPVPSSLFIIQFTAYDSVHDSESTTESTIQDSVHDSEYKL